MMETSFDEMEIHKFISAEQVSAFLRDRRASSTVFTIDVLERVTILCNQKHLAVKSPPLLVTPRFSGTTIKADFARTPIAFQISELLNRFGPMDADPITIATVGAVGAVFGATLSTLTTVATLGMVNSITSNQNNSLTEAERFACSLFSAISSLCEGNALNQSNFSALGAGFMGKLLNLWKRYLGYTGVGGIVTGAGNVKVTECALRCFRYMSRYVSADAGDAVNSIISKSFGDLNGCDCVIQALKQYGMSNECVVEEGLALLKNICDDAAVDNRGKIVKIYDGIGTVIRSIRAHGLSSPPVAIFGMLLVRNMLKDSPSMNQCLVLAGACESSLEILAKYSPDNAEVASAVLSAIELLSISEEGRRRAGQSGVCQLVVIALQTHVTTRSCHMGVAKQATMCIYWLSALPENKILFFKLNIRALLQQLVIDNPMIMDHEIKKIAKEILMSQNMY